MLSLRQASWARVAVCINRETEGVVYADRREGKRGLIAYEKESIRTAKSIYSFLAKSQLCLDPSLFLSLCASQYRVTFNMGICVEVALHRKQKSLKRKNK